MENTILKNRLRDLANRSYNNNQYTFTDFLSLADLQEYYEIERELNFAHATLFGGCDLSERKVIRFGSEAELGYDMPYPIACLKISPLNEKFSDSLNHRDFLGALMNLGIERETLGDIFVTGNHAYLYCLESMKEYIIKNLSKVRHTSIIVKECPEGFDAFDTAKERVTVQVASARVDAVIARVFKLSRDDSIEHFREKHVYINGRLETGNDTKVKDGDRVSVRGFGKFDIENLGGISKKGKLNINVLVYK